MTIRAVCKVSFLRFLTRIFPQNTQKWQSISVMAVLSASSAQRRNVFLRDGLFCVICTGIWGQMTRKWRYLPLQAVSILRDLPVIVLQVTQKWKSLVIHAPSGTWSSSFLRDLPFFASQEKANLVSFLRDLEDFSWYLPQKMRGQPSYLRGLV